MAKVLVVDDAEFLRVRLNKMLDTDGHEVFQAENGLKQYYARNHPMFFDGCDDARNGYDSAERNCQFRPQRSRYANRESVVLEAVKSGARDFVVKPFEHDRVMKAISKLLA
jgi:two-component system chemotaxis response regulator CheY